MESDALDDVLDPRWGSPQEFTPAPPTARPVGAPRVRRQAGGLPAPPGPYVVLRARTDTSLPDYSPGLFVRHERARTSRSSPCAEPIPVAGPPLSRIGDLRAGGDIGRSCSGLCPLPVSPSSGKAQRLCVTPRLIEWPATKSVPKAPCL